MLKLSRVMSALCQKRTFGTKPSLLPLVSRCFYRGVLSLADVNQHVYGADESPRGIVQRGGKRHERHSRAIRPLGDCLTPPNRPALLQGCSHRTLVMRHRHAVEPVKSPRPTPLITVKRWPPAPKRSSRVIEIRNVSFGVGHINRGR